MAGMGEEIAEPHVTLSVGAVAEEPHGLECDRCGKVRMQNEGPQPGRFERNVLPANNATAASRARAAAPSAKRTPPPGSNTTPFRCKTACNCHCVRADPRRLLSARATVSSDIRRSDASCRRLTHSSNRPMRNCGPVATSDISGFSPRQ
jgi:hypothetical protein